jgi:transcriptional regulator with XRE-family HTH domain
MNATSAGFLVDSWKGGRYISRVTLGVNILTRAKTRARDPGELVNGTIARRIALLRKGRQQSFDELAMRCGVSKGMLVQIEQGRANPSIATLCRLAAGLGVSIVDLVSTEEEAPSSVQLVPPGRARILWTGPHGGSATLLVGSDGPDMLELWSWLLQPRERYEARAHSAGTIELVHVEAGALTIDVDGSTQVVAAGASAFARTDRPHAYACHGRAKTRFSMAVFEPGSGRSPSRHAVPIEPE